MMLPGLHQLLSALSKTSPLICTVSRDGVVSELFLDGAPQKVEFSNSWATVEFSGWHIHVNLAHVGQVRFVEAQTHDDMMSAFVSLDDAEGKAILRFYFPHASHTHKQYTKEELALFGRFKEQYQKDWGSGS